MRTRNGVPSVYWVSSGVPNLDMLAACGATKFRGSASGLALRSRRPSLMALLVSCIGLSLLDDSSGGCGDLRPMRGFISRDEVVHDAYDAGVHRTQDDQTPIAEEVIESTRQHGSTRRVHDRGLRSSFHELCLTVRVMTLIQIA